MTSGKDPRFTLGAKLSQNQFQNSKALAVTGLEQPVWQEARFRSTPVFVPKFAQSLNLAIFGVEFGLPRRRAGLVRRREPSFRNIEGMAIDPSRLSIVFYPNPVLRQKAEAVEPASQEVREVAHRMIELMHEEDGLGLAAPQVGLPWRMFVARELSPPDEESGMPGEIIGDQVFVNPKLHGASQDVEPYEEGCLSLPGIRAEIRRPREITITAQDLEGQTFTLTAPGLQGRVWQHEADHLDGVLILDRMRPLDKRANKRSILDLERG